MKNKIIVTILMITMVITGSFVYLNKNIQAKTVKKEVVNLNVIAGKTQQSFKLIKNRKYDLTKFMRFKKLIKNTKYCIFDCFINIKTGKKVTIKKIKFNQDTEVVAKYKVKKKYRKKHLKVVVMIAKDKAIVLNPKINTSIEKELNKIKLKKYGFDFLGFGINTKKVYYYKAPVLDDMFLYPVFKPASLKKMIIKKRVKNNNCKFYVNENPRIINYVVYKKVGKKIHKYIFKNGEKLKYLEHKNFHEYIIKTKKIKIKGAVKIIKLYYKVKYVVEAEYVEKGKNKIIKKEF